jgi:hypothetical protein
MVVFREPAKSVWSRRLDRPYTLHSRGYTSTTFAAELLADGAEASHGGPSACGRSLTQVSVTSPWVFYRMLSGAELVPQIRFDGCRLVCGENAIVDKNLADLTIEVGVVQPPPNIARTTGSVQNRALALLA